MEGDVEVNLDATSLCAAQIEPYQGVCLEEVGYMVLDDNARASTITTATLCTEEDKLLAAYIHHNAKLYHRLWIELRV